MKKLLSLLACLALAVTGAMAQTETPSPDAQTRQAELNTWRTYNIKGEKVSASFPTHPAMTTSGRYREVQKQRLTDRMVGAYADGVVYGVYTYDNPEPRDSFDDFIADDARRDRWDTSNPSEVKIGRYAGREYSSKQNYPSTVRVFAVENRFYKFTATGLPADDPAVKKFFSSISLDSKGDIEVSDGPGTPFLKRTADVLTGKEVTSKARLVMKPEPRYTERARQEQTTGTVVLKVVFSSAGAVENIQTVRELPHGLTEQAIDAARKIKFIPAAKEGKFVSMWLQLEYNFNLY